MALNSPSESALKVGMLIFPTKSCHPTPRESIGHIIDLALLAESLRFDRFWMAEHHEADVSTCSPHMLVPVLARETSRIRVGVGGALLRYRDPYLVAQEFGLLSEMFPNRIDLGVARGLIRGEMSEYFSYVDGAVLDLEKKCQVLTRILLMDGSDAVARPGDHAPDIWMLGGYGAMKTAVDCGVSWCMDNFYTIQDDDTLRKVVESFTRQRRMQSGRSMKIGLAIAGLCGKTAEMAKQWHADASATGFPVELIKPTVVGSCREWVDFLRKAQHLLKVDSLTVLPATYDPEAQRECMVNIAAAISELASDRSSLAYGAGTPQAVEKSPHPYRRQAIEWQQTRGEPEPVRVPSDGGLISLAALVFSLAGLLLYVCIRMFMR